jgi:hypothetical protein
MLFSPVRSHALGLDQQKSQGVSGVLQSYEKSWREEVKLLGAGWKPTWDPNSCSYARITCTNDHHNRMEGSDAVSDG